MKTVLSLCDYTGVMVQPWLDAGYKCVIVDLLHPRKKPTTSKKGLTKVGADIRELHPEHRWLQYDSFDIVFAFPPCTHFTYSGQRWRRSNGPSGVADAWQIFTACWNLCNQLSNKWMIENPEGLLCSWCKPDHTFHPWQYGDNYTKKTCLWTSPKFIMPEPLVKEKPDDVDDRIHKMPPGPARMIERSKTPEGFANAVFHANQLKRRRLKKSRAK